MYKKNLRLQSYYIIVKAYVIESLVNIHKLFCLFLKEKCCCCFEISDFMVYFNVSKSDSTVYMAYYTIAHLLQVKFSDFYSKKKKKKKLN